MNFVTKEPINKGWSSDKKYCVTDENGTRYLLRVSDIAQHDTKQSEFNMMKQVASFGVPMCQPIEFGTCEDGVYSIQVRHSPPKPRPCRTRTVPPSFNFVGPFIFT